MGNQQPKLNEHEIERIIKVLELSTSDVDGEALAAIRMSHRILKKHGSSYEMLVDTVRDLSRQEIESKVSHLETLVQKQSKEISNLKGQHAAPLTKDSVFTSPKAVSGSIHHLKSFLLSKMDLQKYERDILEGISNIPPKSKEEYLVLICARRHKVDYQKT